jgi:RNA recognition motif-containing protein
MRLLLSNLNKLTTTTHVIELLLPFGLVTSARLIINKLNGCSEGVALVEIGYKAGHMAINELHNLKYMNHYISVEETRS